MTLFDKYFESWDAAVLSESAFEDLMSLFAEDVVVQAPQGEVRGKETVGFGIKEILKNYISMKHIWNAKQTDQGLQATWVVAHELRTGEMHAAVGIDFMQLNERGQIRYLEIRPEQHITRKIE